MSRQVPPPPPPLMGAGSTNAPRYASQASQPQSQMVTSAVNQTVLRNLLTPPNASNQYLPPGGNPNAMNRMPSQYPNQMMPPQSYRGMPMSHMRPPPNQAQMQQSLQHHNRVGT